MNIWKGKTELFRGYPIPTYKYLLKHLKSGSGSIYILENDWLITTETINDYVVKINYDFFKSTKSRILQIHKQIKEKLNEKDTNVV